MVASNNIRGDGAYLDNCIDNGFGFCTGSGNVIVDPGTSDSSAFNHNYYNGLEVVSTGSISLDTVTADSNVWGDGALLDNCYNPNDVCEGLNGNGITVLNSIFGDSAHGGGNTGNGLEAYSNGLISLSGVTAELNQENGAALENDRGSTTDGITVSTSTFGDSLLKNGNSADGLDAYSTGTITLTGVTSDDNSNYGAYLNNCDWDGLLSHCAANGDVYVSNSHFDWNNTNSAYYKYGNETGLDIHTNGNVSLNSISASGNLGGDGADVNGSGPLGSFASLSIENSTFNDNYSTSNDWGWGLYTEGGIGNVTLLNVTASGNSSAGTSGGMSVETTGNVSLSGITANSNDGDGADLETYHAGTVTIDLSTGANVFDFNEGNGLEVIVGDCTISLTGVTADKNNADGAYLTNAAPGLNGDIEVTNSTFGDSTTGGNGKNGLEADSNGSITLMDVTADNNIKDGADLDSSSGLVSVDPSSFNNNGGDGLYIDTGGGATVICSTANDNKGYGLDGTIGGVFTDGLTTAGNTLGGNNVKGYSSLVNSVCNPGGGKSGTTTSVGGPGPLPWNVINVPESGGQGNPLSCSQYSGTDLVLPDGDQVLLPCPIGSTPGTSGSLHGLTSGSLPGTLDSKFTFVSAFDAEVTPSLTGGMMTVSFKISFRQARLQLRDPALGWKQVGELGRLRYPAGILQCEHEPDRRLRARHPIDFIS